MVKARERQLFGEHGTTRPVVGLQDGDRASGLGQPDGGSEPVGPAADHDRDAAHDAI